MSNTEYQRRRRQEIQAGARTVRPVWRGDVPPGHKHCPGCDRIKKLEEFWKSSTHISGVSCYCKACCNSKPRKKVSPEIRRERHLRDMYGITPEQYQEMLDRQGGVCKICGGPERRHHRITKKTLPLAVDHNHTTGEVRGLLCVACNHGLGCYEKHGELYRKYLDRTHNSC